MVGLWKNNSWIESVNGVKQLVQDHFQNQFTAVSGSTPQFGENMFSNKLSTTENAYLTAAFIKEEIWEAVKGCDSNGNPGPDGFTFAFFKVHWDLIGDEIFKMME
ncbi:hypothetical protein ACS0TY_007154 [Phlomoides rotata]